MTTDLLDRNYRVLTRDQVDHFMRHGFVRIPEAFSKEKAAEWTDTVWKRLGYDPNDKTTWLSDRVNMPAHRQENVRTFSPKAYAAMCDLLGEDRIDPESAMWGDGFIVNLGKEEWEGKVIPPQELDNWHVDGDFFMHYLDSPEQGLLVIPLFSDVVPNGGGTYISPDGIRIVGSHLRDHPQGVTPRMVPRGEVAQFEDLGWYIDKIKNECTEFHQMTGNVGDVILMHPLMLHSASRNSLRAVRIITNPLVSIKEPFNFDREDPRDYSIVELKTLRDLGVDRLSGWKITHPREKLIPMRLMLQAKMREAEEKRLRGELTEPNRMAGVAVNDKAGEGPNAHGVLREGMKLPDYVMEETSPLAARS